MDPSELHGELTDRRLSILATIVRDARNGAAEAMDTTAGEGRWSLGARALERVMHAVAAAAADHSWLTILDESYHFRFAIGGVPLGIYSGRPKRPHARTLKQRSPELQHMQTALELEGPAPSFILRVAVELDDDGMVDGLWLVQIEARRQGKKRQTVLNTWDLLARAEVKAPTPQASPNQADNGEEHSAAVLPLRAAPTGLPRPTLSRKKSETRHDESGTDPSR